MTEFSSGAVLYKMNGTDILYCLVIRKSDGYTSFPKGHIEGDETETEAALREIREETCVHAKIDPEFRMETEYIMENGIKKHVTYFLASTDRDPSDNPDEPLKTALVSFEEAKKMLKFPDALNILKAANDYILKHARH